MGPLEPGTDANLTPLCSTGNTIDPSGDGSIAAPSSLIASGSTARARRVDHAHARALRRDKCSSNRWTFLVPPLHDATGTADLTVARPAGLPIDRPKPFACNEMVISRRLASVRAPRDTAPLFGTRVRGRSHVQRHAQVVGLLVY